MFIKLFLGLNFLAIIATCNSSQSTSTQSADSDSLLMQQSMSILEHLDKQNYGALLDYFHEDGVRFSPYAYVDTLTHQKLTAKECAALIYSDSVLFWGNYDGSGDDINLSFERYIKAFLYAKPFLHAESHKVNTIEGSGNSLVNMDSIYANFQFTNHYFSGFNPEYGGMDWQCIRLLYKLNKSGDYRLIAIINDRWTI